MSFMNTETAYRTASTCWWKLIALGCLSTAASSIPAFAQNKNEIWPELDLWHRIDAKKQVVVIAGQTRDKELGDKSDGVFGVALDYRKNDRVSFRGGYLFLPGKSSVKGQTSSVENRFAVDFTYRWALRRNSILSDRFRVELRFQDGGVSERYRNRLRIEHTTSIGHIPVIPYANFELYHDSRLSAFSRYRIEGGIDVVFSPEVDFDVYIGRQQNLDPNSISIDGIGVTIGLHF